MNLQQTREIRYGITLALIYQVRAGLGYSTSSVRHRVAYASPLARRAYSRTMTRDRVASK